MQQFQLQDSFEQKGTVGKQNIILNVQSFQLRYKSLHRKAMSVQCKLNFASPVFNTNCNAEPLGLIKICDMLSIKTQAHPERLFVGRACDLLRKYITFMFDFRKFVMKFMSKSPIRHLVMLQRKLKTEK